VQIEKDGGSPMIPDSMLALRKPGPHPGAELQEIPVPRPGVGEALVKVEAASICGTDLHILEWKAWAAKRLLRLDRGPPVLRPLRPLPDREGPHLSEHADPGR
jgi:hypothetical protein